MAVPKGKISKARRNSRKSANMKIVAPSIVECPNCKESKKSHTVCKKCGFYKGKEVIKKKEVKDS